jgi:RND family efflux transporter MFP subunit
MLPHSYSRLAIALTLGILLGGCGQAGSDAKTIASPISVQTLTLTPQPLSQDISLPGRTSASRIAEVRPQVSGIILHRLFEEGANVKAGDPLYQIDPASYQAAFNSASAQLAKSKADAEVGYKTYVRYQALVKRGLISREQFDQAEATWQQAKAQTGIDQASLEQAKIQLGYTQVRAPISGRIGISQVTEGALVTTNQTNSLATIQQLDPIYLDMTQAVNTLGDVSDSLRPGAAPKKVSLQTQTGKSYPQSGSLAFADVSVNESTGSLTLRAIIPNPQQSLLPGMFLRATIADDKPGTGLLLPQTSVTQLPGGKGAVLLVNANNQVEPRQISLGASRGDQWVIAGGLKAGERVIVSGQVKLRPGMAVKATAAIPVSTQAAG